MDLLKRQWTALVCAVGLCAGLTLPAAAAGTYVDVPGGAWYADEVSQVTEKGYMTGVDPTHFVPLANVTRATVVTVLWRMAGSPAPTASSGFSDVAADAWYTQAVDWAKEKKIASGDGKGAFHPDQQITREEMAVLLARYDAYQGIDMAEGALNLFSDANQISSWAKEGVQHAVGMGWLEGTDGKLNPDGLASRAQLAAILVRMDTPAMG